MSSPEGQGLTSVGLYGEDPLCFLFMEKGAAMVSGLVASPGGGNERVLPDRGVRIQVRNLRSLLAD